MELQVKLELPRWPNCSDDKKKKNLCCFQDLASPKAEQIPQKNTSKIGLVISQIYITITMASFSLWFFQISLDVRCAAILRNHREQKKNRKSLLHATQAASPSDTLICCLLKQSPCHCHNSLLSCRRKTTSFAPLMGSNSRPHQKLFWVSLKKTWRLLHQWYWPLERSQSRRRMRLDIKKQQLRA